MPTFIVTMITSCIVISNIADACDSSAFDSLRHGGDEEYIETVRPLIDSDFKLVFQRHDEDENNQGMLALQDNKLSEYLAARDVRFVELKTPTGFFAIEPISYPATHTYKNGIRTRDGNEDPFTFSTTERNLFYDKVISQNHLNSTDTLSAFRHVFGVDLRKSSVFGPFGYDKSFPAAVFAAIMLHHAGYRFIPYPDGLTLDSQFPPDSPRMWQLLGDAKDPALSKRVMAAYQNLETHGHSIIPVSVNHMKQQSFEGGEIEEVFRLMLEHVERRGFTYDVATASYVKAE